MGSIRCQRFWAGLAACLLVLLAACGTQATTTVAPPETSMPVPADTQPASPTPAAEPSMPAAGPTARPTLEATLKPDPGRLTPLLPAVPTPAQGPVTGEVPPDLLQAILQDAEGRTGADRAQFTVLRAEEVTWRDGSLGCPQPGMAYTQALVPGYWVILEVDGQELDYHASSRGSFFLCESPFPRQEPLPGGGSE